LSFSEKTGLPLTQLRFTQTTTHRIDAFQKHIGSGKNSYYNPAVHLPFEAQFVMKVQNRMKSCIITGFVVAFLVSAIPISHVSAEGGLNLPSVSVCIEVFNGTQSYFITNLIGVPSGYDVANGTYVGWCVDSRTIMAGSPETHEVRLFSTCNPPEELASQRWDMVNYILNHKQGKAMDVQQAIWYFINMVGNYTPTRTTAWAIVNDTLANGSGFIPDQGQTMGIICYPLVYSHQPDVQVSIIEVANVIPEFQYTALLPLFMLATISGATILRTRKKNASRSQ
jgi:hypothetical protein